MDSDSDVEDLIRLVPESSDEDIASGINIETPYQPYLAGLDDSFSLDYIEELSNAKYFSMPSPDSSDKDSLDTGLSSIETRNTSSSYTDSNTKITKCAFVLPASFFDIPGNLEHLTLCKPLYIKLIDFKKYSTSLNEEYDRKHHLEAKQNNSIYHQNHLEECLINNITAQRSPSDAKLHEMHETAGNTSSEDVILLDDDDEVIEVWDSSMEEAPNAQSPLDCSNQKSLCDNIFDPKRNTGIVGLKIGNFNSYKSSLIKLHKIKKTDNTSSESEDDNLLDDNLLDDDDEVVEVWPSPVEEAPNAKSSLERSDEKTLRHKIIDPKRNTGIVGLKIANFNSFKSTLSENLVDCRVRQNVRYLTQAVKKYIQSEQAPIPVSVEKLSPHAYMNCVPIEGTEAMKKNQGHNDTFESGDREKENENNHCPGDMLTTHATLSLYLKSEPDAVIDNIANGTHLKTEIRHDKKHVETLSDKALAKSNSFKFDGNPSSSNHYSSQVKDVKEILEIDNYPSILSKETIDGSAVLTKGNAFLGLTKSPIPIPNSTERQSSHNFDYTRTNFVAQDLIAHPSVVSEASTKDQVQNRLFKNCINEKKHNIYYDSSMLKTQASPSLQVKSEPDVIRYNKENELHLRNEATFDNNYGKTQVGLKVKADNLNSLGKDKVLALNNNCKVDGNSSPNDPNTSHVIKIENNVKIDENPTIMSIEAAYQNVLLIEKSTISKVKESPIRHNSDENEKTFQKPDPVNASKENYVASKKSTALGNVVVQDSNVPKINTADRALEFSKLRTNSKKKQHQNTKRDRHNVHFCKKEVIFRIKHENDNDSDKKSLLERKRTTANVDKKSKHDMKSNMSLAYCFQAENSKDIVKNKVLKSESTKTCISKCPEVLDVSNNSLQKISKNGITKAETSMYAQIEMEDENDGLQSDCESKKFKINPVSPQMCEAVLQKKRQYQSSDKNITKPSSTLHDASFSKTGTYSKNVSNESIRKKIVTDYDHKFKNKAIKSENNMICQTQSLHTKNVLSKEKNKSTVSYPTDTFHIHNKYNRQTGKNIQCKHQKLQSMSPTPSKLVKNNVISKASDMGAANDEKSKRIHKHSKSASKSLHEKNINMSKRHQKRYNNVEQRSEKKNIRFKYEKSLVNTQNKPNMMIKKLESSKEITSNPTSSNVSSNNTKKSCKDTCKVSGNELNEKQTIATDCKHKIEIRDKCFKETKVITNQCINVNKINTNPPIEINKAKNQNSYLNSSACEKPIKERENLCDRSKPLGEKLNKELNPLLMSETIPDSHSTSSRSHSKRSMSPETIGDKKGILNILNASLDDIEEKVKIENFDSKSIHKDSPSYTLVEEQVPLPNNAITTCDDVLPEKKLSEKVNAKNIHLFNKDKEEKEGSKAVKNNLKRVDIQEGEAHCSTLENNVTRQDLAAKQLECTKSSVDCDENLKSSLEKKINANFQRKSTSNSVQLLTTSSSTTKQETDNFYSPAVLSVEIFQKTVELLSHTQKQLTSRKKKLNFDTHTTNDAKKIKKISLDEYKARKAM